MVSLKWNFHNFIRISQTWNCFILLEIEYELTFSFTREARVGDVSLLNTLLNDGVPVDSEHPKIGTALRCAAMENRTDVMLLLLDRGADVNKWSDWDQSTALHMVAAWYNSTDIIKVLLKHSASANIKDDYGYTPIDIARAENNEAAVRLLERH